MAPTDRPRRQHHRNRSSNRSGNYRRPRKNDSKQTAERIRNYLAEDAKPLVAEQAAKNSVDYGVNTSPEIAAEYMPALLWNYPELLNNLSWVSLRGTTIPSVPERLVRSQHLFGDNYAFMKKESLDFHVMPDNKARKLEFILGESLRRKRKKVVSFGFVGSSHCLALVKSASQLSLKSEVVLLKAPLKPEALEMVAAMKNLGAKVRLCSTMRGVKFWAALKWLGSKILGSEIIEPGGSTPKGVLGYVSAMIELQQQIAEGVAQIPNYIFVAVGSGSTLVGLEIGRRLLGMNQTQIIGIQTSLDEGSDPNRLAEMGNGTIELLNRFLKKKISFSLKASDFQIERNYLFGGHGQTTPELGRWVARFLETELVDLDSVYTSKALFGMSAYLQKHRISQKSVLFWNTHSPFRRGDLPQNYGIKKLPLKLRSWIKEEQKQGKLVEIGRI